MVYHFDTQNLGVHVTVNDKAKPAYADGNMCNQTDNMFVDHNTCTMFKTMIRSPYTFHFNSFSKFRVKQK